MTEQLISFEVAKLAKEKGYPQSKSKKGKYRQDGSIEKLGITGSVVDDNDEWFEACSQSILARWLREVHKIFVTVSYNKHIKLGWESHVDKKGMMEHSYYCNHSYEEALEEGLREALKLI